MTAEPAAATRHTATYPGRVDQLRHVRRAVASHLAGCAAAADAVLVASELAANAVRHIIDRLCAGSVEQFLLGMVDEKVLSAREIQHPGLQQLVEGLYRLLAEGVAPEFDRLRPRVVDREQELLADPLTLKELLDCREPRRNRHRCSYHDARSVA